MAALSVAVAVGISVPHVPRGPGIALGVAGLASLVLFYKWCGDAAESLARAKGIYHPQYFVLGPVGLIMAGLSRRRG
ncbi:hypothetical protein [Kribbella amoyensis]|uniref:hypothetical protein n=1 Tax=Kribbella amoyensis TaxID=996641 RepID=UPI00119F6CBF|nr:hypothetical protein [Kribbella amoyensis]